MQKTVLNHGDVNVLAGITAANIIDHYMAGSITRPGRPLKAFGIPRGGIPALYAIIAAARLCDFSVLEACEHPEEADLFVDDIIDSGETMQRWCDRYPGKPFFTLIDKTDSKNAFNGAWVVFPWEGDAEGGIEDNVRRLLQFVGEDPLRGGLLETPKRVAKAWQHWTSGYDKDPAAELKVFEDGADGCDEMVIVKDVPFYTHCEHHMAPFFGTASVAYIPNGKIVGLSKISRIVDIFARRLQVQERLTNQIADAINDNLDPKGVGVIITARHLCMESRGICQQGHSTVTSALRGVLKDKPEARAEFMSLVKK
jgi:GTP cyclohydrolase IA